MARRKSRKSKTNFLKSNFKKIKQTSSRVFPIVEQGAERVGYATTRTVKAIAPTMRRGLEGIIDALQKGTNYALSKTRKMMKQSSIKSRRRR